MYASVTDDTSDEIYLVASLSSNQKFDVIKQFCTIDSAFPIFTVDLENNKLYENVRGQAAIIIYNGYYRQLAEGFKQEITLPTHCLVYYDWVENKFEVISDFNFNDLNKGIPILVRFYRNIYCRVDYETPINNNSYKNYICYGDSLTWYNGHNFTWGEHEGETCVGFETYINNELNARNVKNCGANGYSTPQYCSFLVNDSSADLPNQDVLLMMGGNNDDRLNVDVGTIQPVGGTFDTNTVCGALQTAIEYAVSKNPELKIVLMTEPMGWTYRNGTLTRVSELIPQAYRDVAKHYGIPLIDLWKESGINELNRNVYYADPADTTNQNYMYHPNNVGWVRISKIIVKRLKERI